MSDGKPLHRDRIGPRRRLASACAAAAIFLLAIESGRGEEQAPATGAAEPDPAAVVASLPFLDSEELNRIYIDLAKEGSRRRLRVLLDTGANVSVFSPGAARKIGVRPRRTKQDPYRRSTALGRDLIFYVDTRSSDTASRTGWEYGLLGGSFLEHYVVELDFPGERVRFLDPDRYEVPESVSRPDEAVLPILVETSRPGVEVVVNGHPVTMLVDTGATWGVMLSGELAAAVDVPSRRVEGLWLVGVKAVKVKPELGLATKLRLGPLEFERVPVAVSPNGWFNLGYPGDSILGNELLAQFTVRIDYPRRRMWLRRSPDTPMTFLGHDAAALVEKLAPAAGPSAPDS